MQKDDVLQVTGVNTVEIGGGLFLCIGGFI